jgi:hypothetical protein
VGVPSCLEHKHVFASCLLPGTVARYQSSRECIRHSYVVKALDRFQLTLWSRKRKLLYSNLSTHPWRAGTAKYELEDWSWIPGWGSNFSTGSRQALWPVSALCEGYQGPLGRAMAQAVSRQPVTAEDRVCARVNPCGICVGRSGTGTGFSPSSLVFPLSISFHRRSPHLYRLGDKQYVRQWQQFRDVVSSYNNQSINQSINQGPILRKVGR